MKLPIMPPVAPMLARAVEDIPLGDYSYEPKWDGFRSIVFRDRDEVEIGSCNERPMTRYFPELIAALRSGAVLVLPIKGRKAPTTLRAFDVSHTYQAHQPRRCCTY